MLNNLALIRGNTVTIVLCCKVFETHPETQFETIHSDQLTCQKLTKISEIMLVKNINWEAANPAYFKIFTIWELYIPSKHVCIHFSKDYFGTLKPHSFRWSITWIPVFFFFFCYSPSLSIEVKNYILCWDFSLYFSLNAIHRDCRTSVPNTHVLLDKRH